MSGLGSELRLEDQSLGFRSFGGRVLFTESSASLKNGRE